MNEYMYGFATIRYNTLLYKKNKILIYIKSHI